MTTYFEKTSSTYLAQVKKDLGGNVGGIGPLGNPTDIFTEFPRIISTVVGVLTTAAILWFIIQFIMGAFKWISSGGDSKSVESARSQIINAVIGLTIVFASLVLLSVFGGIFGLDVLDLGRMIRQLGPFGAPTGNGGMGNIGP